MNFANFHDCVADMCQVHHNTPLVLKYIDDENDPILISSDEVGPKIQRFSILTIFKELEEMLRLTCILGTDEPIYLHAFGGRPPEPGKLCEGENKVIFAQF